MWNYMKRKELIFEKVHSSLIFKDLNANLKTIHIIKQKQKKIRTCTPIIVTNQLYRRSRKENYAKHYFVYIRQCLKQVLCKQLTLEADDI